MATHTKRLMKLDQLHDDSVNAAADEKRQLHDAFQHAADDKKTNSTAKTNKTNSVDIDNDDDMISSPESHSNTGVHVVANGNKTNFPANALRVEANLLVKIRFHFIIPLKLIKSILVILQDSVGYGCLLAFVHINLIT